ncbi:MAG: hypothetical protein QNJ97_06625 [Myxococcota bacterium]|nr:hypothetical protein [Myxococcota bacterium]
MNDKYKGERVLVFERNLFDALGHFNGINKDANHYLDAILDKKNNHFHLRYLAEGDESLKQIIPYVLLCYQDQIFSYVRGKQAGEARLVGNRSVGIGGHINPQDEMLFQDETLATDRQLYLEAVEREIKEEIAVDQVLNPEIVGLINDDSNPVGRVHFGVVHICRLSNQNVRKREQQITQTGFLPIADLAGPKREELETWSQLCVDFLVETRSFEGA